MGEKAEKLKAEIRMGAARGGRNGRNAETLKTES